MKRSPPHQSAAPCPFAQLKLLNGPSHEPTLGPAEQVRVVPWQGPWHVALFAKMPIPPFVDRTNQSGSLRWTARHGHNHEVLYNIKSMRKYASDKERYKASK